MMSSTTCSLSHSLKSNHGIMSDIYNEMHLTDAGKVFFLLCRFKISIECNITDLGT